MKTFNQVIVLLAVGLLTVSCAKSTSQYVNNQMNGSNNGPGIIPADPVAVDTNPNYTVYGSGSTVTFTPVNLQVMNEYVATRPLNNPTNIKISLNLSHVKNNRYGGEVSISYTDNGLNYNGLFNAGMGSNQTFKDMYDNGKLESEYNYWFNSSKGLTFSGLFQDQYGAITITLVPTNQTPASGNDGEPVLNQGYKGYVYFKNFTTAPAPQSPYRSCWFIYNGPYDCRSDVIQTKCDLFPGAEAGYKLLGTFEGLDVKKAFNISN